MLQFSSAPDGAVPTWKTGGDRVKWKRGVSIVLRKPILPSYTNRSVILIIQTFWKSLPVSQFGGEEKTGRTVSGEGRNPNLCRIILNSSERPEAVP